VAEFIEIADAHDPRLRDYVALRDVTLRRSLEVEGGLFIAEGEKIIRRAAASGQEARSFLLAARWIEGLRDILDASPAPVYVVSERLAEQITGFHVHRGALASMRRPPARDWHELLGVHRLVVCEDIVDHTNVGAIVRCAAGLGWGGVLLAPGAADPLYRRAIKTSMGTVFTLPWARLAEPKRDLGRLREAGFTVAAMALSEDALDLAEFATRVRSGSERVALLLGTEGDGLSSSWLAEADVIVRIPMARGVDSLNVAAAAAVACYAIGPGPADCRSTQVDGSGRPLGDTGQSAGYR